MAFNVIKQCGHQGKVYPAGGTIPDGVLDEDGVRTLKAHGCIEQIEGSAVPPVAIQPDASAFRASLDEAQRTLIADRAQLTRDRELFQTACDQLAADRQAFEAEKQAAAESGDDKEPKKGKK